MEAEAEEEEEVNEEEGDRDGDIPRGAPVEVIRMGGRTPPRGKRGPPGIHPITCAPVVAGSLWILPSPQ